MESSKRSLLEQGLSTLKDNVLRIGSLTGNQTQQAVRALKERDAPLAREVIALDEQLNALRYQVERDALRVIATQQPTAGDLRFIVACMHMAVEMERMADHARGIAEIALRIGDEPFIKPLIDIPRMQEIVCEMLRVAMDAFVKLDVAAGRALIERDQEVDELYRQVLRELLTYMMQDHRTINQATLLLWVAHNLERIGDRAVNLCERIIFAAQGELGDFSTKRQD